MILKKSITIKLITLLFLCPFITYGMKRKRDDNIQTQSKDRCPQEVAETLYALSLGLCNNNSLYNCKYENCNNHHIDYLNWPQLRQHLINDHLLHYICKECERTFTYSDLQTTRCLNNKHHKIAQCPWTSERHQEFFNGLREFNINISHYLYINDNKNDTTKKQKGLIEQIIQHALKKHNSYTCKICNKTYQERNSLEKHLINNHIQPYTCSTCKERVISSSLFAATNKKCNVNPQGTHNIIITELTNYEETELIKKFGLYTEASRPTLVTHFTLESIQPTPRISLPQKNIVPSSMPHHNSSTHSEFTLNQLIDSATNNATFNNLLTNLIKICENNDSSYSCPLHEDRVIFSSQEDFKQHLFISHLKADKCIHCNIQNPPSDKYCKNNGPHIYSSLERLYLDLDVLYLQTFEKSVLQQLEEQLSYSYNLSHSGGRTIPSLSQESSELDTLDTTINTHNNEQEDAYMQDANPQDDDEILPPTCINECCPVTNKVSKKKLKISNETLNVIVDKIVNDNFGLFICTYPNCNGNTSSKCALKNHIRDKHTQLFKCSLCGILFLQKKSPKKTCISKDKKHNIQDYPWTKEREIQLLETFGINHSEI